MRIADKSFKDDANVGVIGLAKKTCLDESRKSLKKKTDTSELMNSTR